LAQFYTASDKAYEGVIRFGFSTNTYDADGEAIGPVQSVSLDPQKVRALAANFQGKIEQMPPPFSAKKIDGVPAYKLARKNREVPLTPVQVEIKEFSVLAIDQDRAQFRARVASGTYMRSVAHELGQLLGCGAHLEALRRTCVAEFTLEEAHTLDELEAAIEKFPINELLVHPRKLLPQLPSVTANDEVAAKIRSGRAVNLPELSRARQVKVFYGQRELLAIATRVAGTLFHPKIVFAAEMEKIS
jgi:tRNA pseudouridine55 synthase